MVGASAGNGLDANYALLCDRGGVSTQDKAGSCGGEFRKTGDREVLVVEGRVVQQNLSGLVPNGIGVRSLEPLRDCK